MRIEIAQRLAPFTHQYSARCRLPGGRIAKIYPSKVEIDGQIHSFPIEAPVKGFTALLNLEKGILSIFGQYKNGYFREDIKVADVPDQMEKVSFGCHKAQNWDCMNARRTLEELLPHWHRLAQWEGDIKHIERASEDTLLGICQNADRFELGDALLSLYDGAFTDYFADSSHRWHQMGFPFPPSDGENVLVQGAARLRRALIAGNDHSLWILPVLPKELHCGRYLHADFAWGSVDFEWTKGLVRRMILHSRADQEVFIHFQKDIFSLRLTDPAVSAQRRCALSSDNILRVQLEKGRIYYFDRFEK